MGFPLWLVANLSSVLGQTAAADTDQMGVSAQLHDIGPGTLLELLREGDVTLWALVVCSVITVTFVLERLIVLRSRRVIPPKFIERFMDRINDKALDSAKAMEFCRENGSPIASIFAIVSKNWGRPAAEIRAEVTARAESEIYPLRRRLRALGGMATMAPLLGLFGTVIGMIKSFHALGQHSATGKTELLASGISLALIATASGLAIALFASASYYLLNGRVDRLTQQMDLLAHELIDHVSAESEQLSNQKTPRVVRTPKHVSV